MDLTNSSSEVSRSSPRLRINYVLKKYFGRFWPLYVLGLLLLVFWPILVFRTSIAFNPAAFVSEWVKLSIELIFLYFIIQIVRYRSAILTARQSLLDLIMTDCMAPAARVIDSLKNFRQAFESDNMNGALQNIDAAQNDWAIIVKALSDEKLSAFSSERERVSWLKQSRNTLNPEKCGSILEVLVGLRRRESFNKNEFKELLRRLEVFQGEVAKLYDS